MKLGGRNPSAGHVVPMHISGTSQPPAAAGRHTVLAGAAVRWHFPDTHESTVQGF
jgi:hypothetical protein